MLAEIDRREFVTVEELSERFGISCVTVRSDLNELAARMQIHRIRGGAVARSASGQERPFEQTQTSFALEKRAIGHAAAELIHHGETVLLDVGTTAVATARALAKRTDVRDVTVFTNGIKTALELEPAIPRLNVILLGGTLRPLQHSLVDPFASAILRQINVNTVFLGCNGVHAGAGVTNVNLPEAEVKKRMLGAAHRRIVLADGSKIGRIELANLCSIDDIDAVITGESADPVAVQTLVDRGCDVRIVG
jgi:DeoR family transcriptional regulator of aga operon